MLSSRASFRSYIESLMRVRVGHIGRTVRYDVRSRHSTKGKKLCSSLDIPRTFRWWRFQPRLSTNFFSSSHAPSAAVVQKRTNRLAEGHEDFSEYCLENLASILAGKFPGHAVWVVMPKTRVHGVLASYDNFVKADWDSGGAVLECECHGREYMCARVLHERFDRS